MGVSYPQENLNVLIDVIQSDFLHPFPRVCLLWIGMRIARAHFLDGETATPVTGRGIYMVDWVKTESC